MEPHPYRRAFAARDLDGLAGLLADDVVFHSPVIADPGFEGRGSVTELHAILLQAIKDLEYTHELGDGSVHFLVANGRVLGKPIKSTTILEFNEEGKVREMWVMVRPLTGLVAIGEAIGSELAKRRRPSLRAVVRALSKPLAGLAAMMERGGSRLIAALNRSTRRPGVSTKSRTARVLGRAMRMPGLYWMFHGAPGTPRVIVLVNRGRKSGRLYKTPLSILAEDRERAEIFVSPMWSRDSDWYRNVIAGGLVAIHVRGEKQQVEWRELDEAEGRARGDAFRNAYPIYSRMILRRLARLNKLEGDPAEAVVQNLPMLGVRRVGF
jgi:deazaflavin-dependent oxidoreductase (nitroreductase family)